jgi:hypothetical protein
MRRTAGVGTVLVLISVLLVSAAPAAAGTRGKERLRGVVIATNQGGQRTVVSGWAIFRGVLNATARIVEVANRPGDPDNVSRDNLVFAGGTMHIVSTNKPPTVTIDPMTCAYSVRLSQTTKITGGTRRFRRASGTTRGTIHDWGVAARKADGSCDQQSAPLIDVADLAGHGKLSF